MIPLTCIEIIISYNPKDTKDRTFKFESFVITVKKESVDNLSDRVCWETLKLAEVVLGLWDGELCFPTMVNSVMRLLKQTILCEEEEKDNKN